MKNFIIIAATLTSLNGAVAQVQTNQQAGRGGHQQTNQQAGNGGFQQTNQQAGRGGHQQTSGVEFAQATNVLTCESLAYEQIMKTKALNKRLIALLSDSDFSSVEDIKNSAKALAELACKK